MNYLKSILFLFISICSGGIYAQDTTKVLFIGNSFTSANNLPQLFSQLSSGAGHTVVIAAHMPGGISVGDIRQGAQAHMNNPHVYNLIKGNEWDFMVLQDNQGRFSHPYGQFANPVTQSSVIKGHLQLRDSLMHYNPCAQMLWFGGFGTKDGTALGYTTGLALIEAIYANYNFLNDTAQEVIAPIGPAFMRIIANHPSINLWGSDNTHPSLHGSFLTSCVIYSTIFKQSPLASTFNAGISASTDSLFKTIAYQTTLDSLNATRLNSITPPLIKVNNTLTVNGYQQCSWFYNNAPYSSTNCTALLNQSGAYFALVTDSNGCTFKTLDYAHTADNVSERQYLLNQVSLFPNPSTGIFKLSLGDLKGAADYSISTANGKIIERKPVDTETTWIDLSDQPSGLYILQVMVGEKVITKKISKR